MSGDADNPHRRLAPAQALGALLLLGPRPAAAAAGIGGQLWAAAGWACGLWALVAALRQVRQHHLRAAAPDAQGGLWAYIRLALCLLSLGLWATIAQGAAASWVPPPGAAAATVVALACLWLLAAGERALTHVDRSVGRELPRAVAAMGAAARLWACAASLTAAVWGLGRLDATFDWQGGQQAIASPSTRALAMHLAEPLQVTSFFAAGDEVGRRVALYLGSLPANAPVTLAACEVGRDAAAAADLGVRNNGQLVLSLGGRHQKLWLGQDLGRARPNLRRLDEAFAHRLQQLAAAPQVIYCTTGHHERLSPAAGGTPATPTTGPDGRPPLRQLAALWARLGAELRPLGLAQGLGQQVPPDAAMVAIVGPRSPLAPAELEALRAYLRGGGRLFVALDPDDGPIDPALAALVGVRLSSGRVQHDSARVSVPQRRAAAHDIFSDRRGDHPLLQAFAQTPGATWVALGSAAIAAADPADQQGGRYTALVPTMPDSQLLPAEPLPAPWALVAAIQGSSADADADEGDAKAHAGRAVVLGDVDALGDGILQTAGNATLMADCARWLLQPPQAAGSSEPAAAVAHFDRGQDVIVHRRAQDRLWFWGLGFGVPAAVALAGSLRAPRRRRRPPQGPST